MRLSASGKYRIATGGVDSSNHGFVLAFFSDGFVWHEDELEDFVAFYRTGRHRQDDGLAKMEQHGVQSEQRSLTRRISAFCYLCRRVNHLLDVHVEGFEVRRQ